jgi:guanylate kinase
MTTPTPTPRGLLIIVSSPSGAGKTTLCRRLMGEFPDLRFSVSVTTRKPRPGEQNGVDYIFVDEAEFERLVASGAFAEHAVVHGNRYGTLRTEVDQALEGGCDVLFDIDWQGGRQLKEKFPHDAVMIWILPPSLRALEDRLRRRATDTPQAIENRLATAKQELTHFDQYDYLIVNQDLEKAYDSMRSIYVAEHCATHRARPLAERLLEELEGKTN